MENKCLNVIRSTKNKFQPWMLWVVGQFLLNNERQRFELWGRAYNFRARAPTERRIIPRESSGNALEPHAWLDLASSWFLSFFLLFLKYFRHRINLLSRLYSSRRDREDRGRETVETVSVDRQTSRRIRTPFRSCCTRFLRQVVRVLA